MVVILPNFEGSLDPILNSRVSKPIFFMLKYTKVQAFIRQKSIFLNVLNSVQLLSLYETLEQHTELNTCMSDFEIFDPLEGLDSFEISVNSYSNIFCYTHNYSAVISASAKKYNNSHINSVQQVGIFLPSVYLMDIFSFQQS